MITKKTKRGNMINNKEKVNVIRNLLLSKVKEMFKGQDHDLLDVFKNSINGTINKTAHDINMDIIEYGEFKGWSK
tara:strand:+ start:324 stop:548 length:225 start_codon:yes stop_codon:yes gene_type:complete